MNSWNVLAGKLGWAARNNGEVATSETGIKSRFGSYEKSLYKNGLMDIIDPSVTRKLYPSGGDAISVCAATTPFAPGLLSTTTELPRRSDNRCAVMRATVSGSPPGAYGTMNLMGRLG